MTEKKEPPHVVSRPWDGSHPPPATLPKPDDERGLIAIRHKYADDLDLSDELGECDPFLESLNEAFNLGVASERGGK